MFQADHEALELLVTEALLLVVVLEEPQVPQVVGSALFVVVVEPQVPQVVGSALLVVVVEELLDHAFQSAEVAGSRFSQLDQLDEVGSAFLLVVVVLDAGHADQTYDDDELLALADLLVVVELETQSAHEELLDELDLAVVVVEAAGTV